MLHSKSTSWPVGATLLPQTEAPYLRIKLLEQSPWDDAGSAAGGVDLLYPSRSVLANLSLMAGLQSECRHTGWRVAGGS